MLKPTIIFREYTEKDLEALEQCMQELQGYTASLDRWGKIRLPVGDFVSRYTRGLLQRVMKEEGGIFLAEVEQSIIGCVAGVIERMAYDHDMADSYPCVQGRVLELYVVDQYRRQRIGAWLMEHIEDYFRKKNCDSIRVESFGLNHPSQRFYERNGYEVWTLDYIKKLET